MSHLHSQDALAASVRTSVNPTHQANPNSPATAGNPLPSPTPCAKSPELRTIKLDLLSVAAQAREALSGNQLDDLAERFRDGLPVDPIVVVEGLDGVPWIVDGHHRVTARRREGFESIPALVHETPAGWDAPAWALRLSRGYNNSRQMSKRERMIRDINTLARPPLCFATIKQQSQELGLSTATIERYRKNIRENPDLSALAGPTMSATEITAALAALNLPKERTVGPMEGQTHLVKPYTRCVAYEVIRQQHQRIEEAEGLTVEQQLAAVIVVGRMLKCLSSARASLIVEGLKLHITTDDL